MTEIVIKKKAKKTANNTENNKEQDKPAMATLEQLLALQKHINENYCNK